MQLSMDPMAMFGDIATVENTIQTVNSPMYDTHTSTGNTAQLGTTDSTKRSVPGWERTYNALVSILPSQHSNTLCQCRHFKGPFTWCDASRDWSPDRSKATRSHRVNGKIWSPDASGNVSQIARACLIFGRPISVWSHVWTVIARFPVSSACGSKQNARVVLLLCS